MSRFIPAAAFALLVFTPLTTYGQIPARAQHDRFPAGNIEGRVLDEKQVPVAGAMVSVVGRATAAATTDRDGRYALKDLPYGPYVLTVHARGYWQPRARTVQLTSESVVAPALKLTQAAAQKVSPQPGVIAALPPSRRLRRILNSRPTARTTPTARTAPVRRMVKPRGGFAICRAAF
jgi:hypothetical protein